MEKKLNEENKNSIDEKEIEITNHLKEMEVIKSGNHDIYEVIDGGWDSNSTSTSTWVLNNDTKKFYHLFDLCWNGQNTDGGDRNVGYRPDRKYVRSIGEFEVHAKTIIFKFAKTI